tara:strand:- start:15220 stop:15513 length:294 start_codon:yes stop_codon:yes gene_type:complete
VKRNNQPTRRVKSGKIFLNKTMEVNMSINDRIVTIALDSWTNVDRWVRLLKSVDDTISQVDNNPEQYCTNDPWVMDLQNFRDRVAMVLDRVQKRSAY